MPKPPAFQFYANDFLGGVISFSNEERGLYITLLSLQWSRGYVTEDDFSQLGSAMALPSIDRVRGKFKTCAKMRLKNERMEQERRKQNAFRANRSKSGTTGANKRWHSHGTAIQQPMAKHSSPSPSPSPIISISKRAPEEDWNQFNRMKGVVCTVFNRASERLSNIEESTLAEIARRAESEVELKTLLEFKPKPESYFPRSIEALLTNWDKTLDRAKNYDANRKNSSKGVDRNAGGYNANTSSEGLKRRVR